MNLKNITVRIKGIQEQSLFPSWRDNVIPSMRSGKSEDKILNGAGRPTTGNCQKRRAASVSLTAKHKSIFSVLLLGLGTAPVHSSHLARMT